MKAYFLNISEDEKKSITNKHSELYNGYQVMQPKGNMTPLTVGNYALDEEGVTVNSRGDVTEYKNTGINKPMKKMCEECGDMYEGEMCECGTGKMYEDECNECGTKMYTEEQIEEGIKLKSKKDSVIKEINESLNWFKKLI
jgi:hypothetical protein